MLVGLEVQKIGASYGAITPELAIGYRAGLKAREHFSGLDNVTVLVHNSTGAAFALKQMIDPAYFKVEDQGRHIFSFCHLYTKTILRMKSDPNMMTLPSYCREIENQLLDNNTNPSPEDLKAYHGAVDRVVRRLLIFPDDYIFSVSSYRCRQLADDVDDVTQFARCERCNNSVRLNRLYDVEGFQICVQCAGIDPSWFSINREKRCETE